MRTPLSAEFDGLGERAWLNTAHQGAIPGRAAEAGRAAIERKRAPWKMEPDSWEVVPRRVRAALAGLIAAREEDIVLATSASYGLELLARTLPLEPGDEVLLVDGDFPAPIYPWLPLRDRGIAVRLLAPETPLDADRLAGELGPSTRVFCSSWVFSFSGRVVDPPAVGEACAANGTTYIVNATQAIGRARRPFTNCALTPSSARASSGCAAPTPPGSSGSPPAFATGSLTVPPTG